MAGEPLEDDGFSEDYDDRMGTFYEPKIDREHHNFRGAYVRRRRPDDDPCPFDDANHGVSATRRRSYRGGDGQYVEYNSDEYRDQFSKDEDDRDLAAICRPCPRQPVTGEGPPRVRRALLTRWRSVWDRSNEFCTDLVHAWAEGTRISNVSV